MGMYKTDGCNFRVDVGSGSSSRGNHNFPSEETVVNMQVAGKGRSINDVGEGAENMQIYCCMRRS